MVFLIQRLLILFFYIDRQVFITARKYERLLYKILFIGFIFFLLIYRNNFIYNKLLNNTNLFISRIEKNFFKVDVIHSSQDILSIDGLILLINDI